MHFSLAKSTTLKIFMAFNFLILAFSIRLPFGFSHSICMYVVIINFVAINSTSKGSALTAQRFHANFVTHTYTNKNGNGCSVAARD